MNQNRKCEKPEGLRSEYIEPEPCQIVDHMVLVDHNVVVLLLQTGELAHDGITALTLANVHAQIQTNLCDWGKRQTVEMAVMRCRSLRVHAPSRPRKVRRTTGTSQCTWTWHVAVA